MYQTAVIAMKTTASAVFGLQHCILQTAEHNASSITQLLINYYLK